MGLNIVSTGGDFDPYVKYNGKAGRWYVKKDEQEVEVANPVFVADFANIKTGWFKFAAGMAPDKVFDKSLSEPAVAPTSDHRRGFEVRLFSTKTFGGVVVLSGSSMHLNNAIAELYGQYEAAPEAKAGKLPVVKATGTTPMKDPKGTNYKPVFAIEKWVERPAELNSTEPAKAAPAQAVAAPAPVQSADDSEF